MRINKIELYNIGSYEGRNCFDIKGQSEQGKIVLIGGKNGAGKTTLFTAIKLCLYGYKEAGYQAANSFYKKQIKKLINDKAKIQNSGQAFVMLDVDIHNGHAWDNYFLKRFWSLKQDNFEKFQVWKNDEELNSEQISDFENYLLNLIPPELFDLYFFDGEQIADFFLENSGNERVKKAFLTLCGYDTFDILYKNFKRINRMQPGDNDVMDRYFAAEDELYSVESKCKEYEQKIDVILNEIEVKASELKALEERYTLSGGVSIAEWNEKFLELKYEERIREEKNAWLKQAANDVIPYIILQSELKALLNLMESEREQEQLETAKDVLEAMLPDILKELDQDAKLSSKICNLFDKKLAANSEIKPILKLSNEEYSKLGVVIDKLLTYKKEDVIKVRNEIKKSLNRSKKIREVIENSSVEGVELFLSEKQELIDNREEVLKKRDEVSAEYAVLLEKKGVCDQVYKKISKELDAQFKSQSVCDLSVKAIVFLDQLQKRLFQSEILKVQNLFMDKMKQLMRKKNFIDSIEIDDDFNVHIYKKVLLDCKGISKKILSLKETGYEKEYGLLHCKDLLEKSGCNSLNEFANKYRSATAKIEVVLEFDKSTMSKGEKQVFIMSLYWAMMQLCKKDIPFVIDTPFARIDTEHRAHITKYFFKELSGQVFIFSTNEEITREHVQVIGKDLQATFLIENIDNKRTIIEENKYFGEE